MNATAMPQLDGTIKLRDGRRIAYSEWGDVRGRPVIMHGGRPGSRLFCPDDEATDAAGVRLITIDRPGYGLSDPRPGRTYEDWVQDYVELAGYLDLPACSVMAISGGGPYALASAVYAPDRVLTVGLAAIETSIDHEEGAWGDLDPEGRALFELVRSDPDAAMEGLKLRYQSYADGVPWLPEVDFDSVDPDTRLLSRSDVRDAFMANDREGRRQGSTGALEDVIAVVRPWGFSLADVSHEVHIWWGGADAVNAPTRGDRLAKALPRASLVTYPGEGHLASLNHWREILAALA